MNRNHDFFQVNEWSEDQKKGLHQIWTTFFPRIQVQTCAQMQTRVILLRDADVDHTQIIGGEISPHPPPPGFGTPALNSNSMVCSMSFIFSC